MGEKQWSANLKRLSHTPVVKRVYVEKLKLKGHARVVIEIETLTC